MEAEQVSFVQQFDGISKENVEFTKKCIQLSSRVNSNELSILELIEQLGPLLIDASPENREKGTLVLSTVLQNVLPSLLPSAQLNFICGFYADRLNDHHQVIPAVLKGLIPLAKFENVPDGAATRLLTCLFENIPCQQQQRNDRHCIYEFFKIVLDKRKDEVTAMGLHFVLGVISAMDGERDPRNLMYLFSWLPRFLNTVDLKHLTEEMFEVIACYFPIDFKAPPQDPNGISRDALAEALSPCLCAIPSFSSHCIPLALEKLDSELRMAKLDSLSLIMDGCSVFPVDIYVLHSTEIWSLLQKQIMSYWDQEIETKSLLTLTCFIRKLSLGDSTSCTQVVKDITDTVKGNLRPDTKLFESSSKILITIARASQKSSEFIIEQIMPLLINLYNITLTPDHQVAVFKVLIRFVQTHLSWHGNGDLNEIDYLKVTPSLCLKAIVHHNQLMVSAGFEGFEIMAEYVPAEVRRRLYDVLSNMLITPCPEELRNAMLNCLRTFSRKYRTEILELIGRIKVLNEESLKLYLEALSFVAVVEDFRQVALHIIIVNTFESKDSSRVALKVLGDLLENNETDMQTYLLERENIIERLVNWFLDVRLEEVAPVLKLLIGNLNTEDQTSLITLQLQRILPLFRQSMNSDIVLLLHGLLCRRRPEVNINCEIIEELTDVCLIGKSLSVNKVGAQLIGNIVNKETDESKLKNYLDRIEYKCMSLQSNLEGDDRRVEHLVDVVSFVTKALVMRNHQLGPLWVTKLLEITTNFALAAKGFKIIMNDDGYDCFGVKSHCVRRPLYRQKVFVQVITSICDEYGGQNDNYLLVLGYLLTETPKQILRLELKKLTKLILMCLEKMNEPEVICAMLANVLNLIEEKDPIIDDYFQEFLSRALMLLKFKSSMKVRVLAVKCIYFYTFYPHYKLLPLRDEVLIALGTCLDDQKRLVRKEAVEARSACLREDGGQPGLERAVRFNPDDILVDFSSEALSGLEVAKSESVVMKLEEEVPPQPDQSDDSVPPVPKIFDHVPSVISNEDYAGPYNFEAFIDPDATKSPWVFSVLLNKVFILWLRSFPVDFKWTQNPMKRFFVRAMPLYSQPQESHKPVMRCFNHSHKEDKTNKGMASHIWKHIIRASSVNTDHVRYVGEQGQHLSVVFPLGQPQTGVDTVRHMYEFVCQNSCPSGMDRRPIEVVFTLEDENGHVLGRRSVNVRICSCPKRDKEKEENEHLLKSGQSKPPPSRKRKMDNNGEKKPLSFTETANDTKEYEITMKIVGKQNVKEMYKHGFNLMAGEYFRRGNDEYKNTMKEFIHALKNLPE